MALIREPVAQRDLTDGVAGLGELTLSRTEPDRPQIVGDPHRVVAAEGSGEMRSMHATLLGQLVQGQIIRVAVVE